MGYLGAKIDLATVRSKMAKSRTAMRQNRYLTGKAKKFCDDTEAFNWVCRHYRYNYTEWNGNVEPIWKETYEQYLTLLTDASNFAYTMKLLKQGGDLVYPDSERQWLIKEARTLRNRYK